MLENGYNIRWPSILRQIKSNTVIPVVGDELLMLEISGRKTTLYRHIAELLADEFHVEIGELKSNSPLAEVAYAHSLNKGDPSDVYYETSEIIHSKDWPIPEPLLKLSEIDGFDLFISLTPDDLLVNALNEVRGDSQSHSHSDTNVLSFAPNTNIMDLPDAYGSCGTGATTVFKIFGDVCNAPDFALTEEDTLKYIHCLQDKNKRPSNLFDVLHERSLAFLGCNLENWLLRFFLCSAKSDLLFGERIVRGVIADDSTIKDIPLIPFLARNQTKVYQNGNSVDFVNMLHDQWMERSENSNDSEIAIVPSNQSKSEHQIFISYANEDRSMALSIKESFEANRIKVWMDDDSLSTGDKFEKVIHDNIRSCSAFVTIISKNTIQQEKRFFRKEWNWAMEESTQFPINYQFLIPVVIDDTNPTDPEIPPYIKELHWVKLSDLRGIQTFTKNVVRNMARLKMRQG